MSKVEVCPLCSVRIEDDLAYYSVGPCENRKQLAKRICSHVKHKPGCINKSMALSQEPLNRFRHYENEFCEENNDFYSLPFNAESSSDSLPYNEDLPAPLPPSKKPPSVEKWLEFATALTEKYEQLNKKRTSFENLLTDSD
jgi:hypothetical protein